MARKKNWFSTVKKVLSPESKEKKEQRASKSKNKWFAKQKEQASSSASLENLIVPTDIPHPGELTLSNAEIEQSYSISPATVTTTADDPPVADIPVADTPATDIPAADTPVADAAPTDSASIVDTQTQTVVEVVQVTPVTQFTGRSSEEAAAIKIQTAFRGYLARRALRALRGLVRLTSLVQGSSVKRQAANTLKCMQTISRVQSQIRSRRIRMSEENLALQRQLQEKHAKEIENLRVGDEWDDSLQSKQQIETSLLSKHEAAMRRERAMAYAFSHQQTWKNTSSKTSAPLFMDPSNPTWGWSWLERWMATRPWEAKSTTDKEPNSNEQSSTKTTIPNTNGGEINKSFARHQLNLDKPSPPALTQKINQSSKRSSSSTPTSIKQGAKLKLASPRASISAQEDDLKSIVSVGSEINRRHSIAGSSVRDDTESLGSSPSLPSYMVPTESTLARVRLPSPLGAEKSGNGTLEKGLTGPVKKRLSYPASPARARRHSGPPRVNSSPIAELTVKN